MKRKLLLFTLLVIVLNGTLFAKNEEKEIFDILVEYRADIPERVIKKVRKEMGKDSYRYPRIHDSWIENPEGKSIDLNGNVLFPEITYNKCKQVSPTHFEVENYDYSYNQKKGVVRTDGKVIVPIENQQLHYFPPFNVIVAQVDWEEYGGLVPSEGQVKIYDYYGNLLYTFDGVSELVSVGSLDIYANQPLELSMKVGSKKEKVKFRRFRSDEEQDQITKFFSEGPQAVTYNIIRQLCASNKKGDQKKALRLLRYFMLELIPQDYFNKGGSTLAWDATIRHLACVNYTKDYSYFGVGMNSVDPRSPFRYYYVRDYKEPLIFRNNPNLPKNDGLAAQAEQLMWLAYNDYENKKIRDQERAEMWLAVLGVLSNALGQNGSYTPASGSGTSINTTTIPPIQTGHSMLDQTTVSPEVMSLAMSAGWQPETTTSTTSDTSTSTSSQTTPSKRICHACFGKGIHQACNGTGNVVAFGNKRLEKCTGCNGTGKCPHCNGGYY